jgi:drug/metabolite transporter (DMT)-like permease
MAGGERTVAITGTMRPSWTTWALLAVGVGAASMAAILIRYASAAEPLAISFWRCAAAAVVLAPFARVAGRPPLEPVRTSAVAGAFLAVHFAAWITSLDLTTVASSVLLVSTTPIFVALAARLLFSERLPPGAWAGVVASFAGAALVGGGSLGGSSAVGDALALAGGATAAGYVLAGSVARRTLGIVVYAVVAYSVSAVLLLVVCIATGVALGGWPAATWWAIAGIVVGPQLLGHTVINLVLRALDATTVAVAIMAEPVIATALAYLLFDEAPSLLVYPGGAAILAGIYLTSRERAPAPEIVE